MKFAPVLNAMEKALRDAGCRVTSQRRAILEYLASTDAHPSARTIFDEVRKLHPEVSLATIYNTLRVLSQRGLVKVLEFGVDNRYDTNLVPHINLICTSCGRIQDLRDGFSLPTEEVNQKTGFQILDYRVEYYGICRQCRGGDGE